MKIVKLTAENFKRLVAVAIEPNGSVVEISGKNGSGKSSTLDAIEAAIGGAGHSPEKPVRRGATGSRVVVDLGDLVVTRKWTSKGDSLVVESRDGLKYPKPQAVLDRLTSGLSFDPLAFARLKPREQAAQLRELVGLDTSKLDAERDRVFTTRTGVNSDVRQIETQLASIDVPEAPGEIGEEIDVLAINDKKTEAAIVSSQNAEKRRLARVEEEKWSDAEEDVDRLTRELDAAQSFAKTLFARMNDAKAAAEALIDPDTSTIDAEIAAAKKHNAEVRERQHRASIWRNAKQHADVLATRLETTKKKQSDLSDRLKGIEAKKTELLAAAKFPVPGMSVEGDQVLIDGVPFSQASTAEQIKCGLAMGAALNPKLRVILCRDGSLLDEESMRIVAEWAAANDVQLWLERVSNGEPCGIVIEDGQAVHRTEVAKVVTP